MRKQTVRVIFYTLIHLILFAIGPLVADISGRSDSDYEAFYDDNKDTNKEKELVYHRNTENSDLEKYIMEADCREFNISFNFSHTNIKALGKDFINSLFVTCLNFEGNQIESVESGAFNNVPALQYLNMERNYISFLFSFNGHNNLKTLILARQLSYYDRNLKIIGEYPELRYLDLSGNRISSINWPRSDENSYYRINRKSPFPKLQYLDLSYNNLYEFYTYYDESILFNQSIIYLDLSNNNMNNLDLRVFTNLIELKLDNNDFISIHKHCYQRHVCIDEMPKLKYFSIANNKLNNIHQYIFMNTPKLVTLNISNNELEDISPELFYNLNSLENLYLDNNKLSSIYSVISLSSLSVLSLAHNKIQEIDPEEIINAYALKKLYLDHNAIKNIHESIFSKLELLEELYLDSNNLIELPIGWDNNLKNLRYLNLSNNKFKFLEALSLSESLPVIRIDLINNNLIHMKTKILRNLPKNATIYLISQSEDSELSTRNL
ncbi:hypothetical protein V1478_013653 [Vespula squamosa]|uniref:Uncharacterized protein n=1 Tax=Vespula squamosa TaxID=30214 RepID=A0ABD2A639_VESSQ